MGWMEAFCGFPDRALCIAPDSKYADDQYPSDYFCISGADHRASD